MLRIRLANDEQLVINGAVVRAEGRVQLIIENEAALLRGRDVMRPDQADTPVRRLYYATMLAYLDPAARDEAMQAMVDHLGVLAETLLRPEAKALLGDFARALGQGDHYHALTVCRSLMAYEQRLIGLAA